MNTLKQEKDFDFIAAISAVRDLKKKGDPESGARLGLALGARKWYRILTEMVRQQATGPELLDEQPNMGEYLNDWDSLRQLPDGSLGREYLRWAEAEQLTVKGLEEAVATVYDQMDQSKQQDYIRHRTRDLHDLFHVLTGYGRDSGGETALLIFTATQHRNRSLWVLSVFGLLGALFKGRFDIVRLRSKAKQRARRAKFLLVEPWEKLLSQPLEEVRRDMQLLPTPSYVPFVIEREAG